MSERRSKLPAQVFEIVPVKPLQPQNRRWLLLGVGVIFPAAVIVFELGARFCAQALFDPMPTPWHALAVSFAPASNLLIWLRVYSGKKSGSKWLTACSGAAIAIGGFYALLFAPLLPLAILAIMLSTGIGLSPWPRIAAFCSALLLRRSFVKAVAPQRHSRHFWGGLAAGVALLLALDISPTATRYGLQLATSYEPQESQRGLWLLRHLGDENLLLRLCYDVSAKPAGLISWILLSELAKRVCVEWLRRFPIPSPTRGRSIIASTAWPSTPGPHPSLHAGTPRCGGAASIMISAAWMLALALKGSIWPTRASMASFSLRRSRLSGMDVAVQKPLQSGQRGAASACFTPDGRRLACNAVGGWRRTGSSLYRAQRGESSLSKRGSPGARSSACYGERPGSHSCEAFPVARNGGAIKFKIGITAPLDLNADGKARLALPQIVERNFDLGENATHALWIESEHSLSSNAPGLAARDVTGGAFRIEGEVTDRALTENRKIIDVAWKPSEKPVASRIGDGEIVEQSIERETLAPPSAIMIVVDGSARTKAAMPGLLAALDALPANAKAGLMIAGDDTRELPIGPWTEDHKNAALQALQTADFIGGQDNTVALVEAFNRLGP